MNRNILIEKLPKTIWDILVIGGGATGLGVALDAASRGLKVALLEKKDYASGPSSTSTKLIHGGIRYLEKAIKELNLAQYRLVKDALHERQIMLQNAPHISNTIPFIIPVYSNPQKWYYFLGTKIYDLIAGKNDIPHSTILSKSDTLLQFPPLNHDKLKASILYYDGQFNDAFYATALMRTAIQYGACCLNYVELLHAEWDNIHKLYLLKVQDAIQGESYEVKTKLLINCAGVQADTIRKMVFPTLEPRLRPSKGAHIVLPRKWLPTNQALLIPSTEDGRVIFIIPWYYAVIIGTTDTEPTHPIELPTVTQEDINYILRQVNPYLSQPIQVNDIIGSFAGLRPLVKANKSKTEALIRSHEVEVFKQKHFISVLGGKWTTYRQMAEEAVNAAYHVLNLPQTSCKTHHLPLIGASTQKFHNFTNLPPNIHQHLHYYGAEYPVLLKYLQNYGTDFIVDGYPFTIGEIFFLKEHAQIITAEDTLLRGTRLGIIDHHAAKKAMNTLLQVIKW